MQSSAPSVKNRGSKGSGYKYVQIADDLKDKIRTRFYDQDRPFPSQAQIMEEYDVSLLTVRQVLNKLQSEGLVESFRGKGTFVRRETDFPEDRWNPAHFIGLACVGGAVSSYPLPNSRYVQLVQGIQSKGKELLTWFGDDLEELKHWARRVGALLLYNYVTNEMIAEMKRRVPRVIMVGCLDEAAPKYEVPCFDYDIVASGLMGIDLLAQAGRRRLAFVNDDTRHHANTSVRDAVLDYAPKRHVECREFIYSFEENQMIAQNAALIEQLKAYKPDGVLLKGGGSKALFHYSNLCRAGWDIPRDLSLVALADRSPLEASPESIVRIRKHLPPDDPCDVADVTVIHGDSQMFRLAVSFALENPRADMIVHQTVAPRIYFGKTVGLAV